MTNNLVALQSSSAPSACEQEVARFPHCGFGLGDGKMPKFSAYLTTRLFGLMDQTRFLQLAVDKVFGSRSIAFP